MKVKLYDEVTRIHVPKHKVVEDYPVHDDDRVMSLNTIAFKFVFDDINLSTFFIIIHKHYHNDELFELDYEIFAPLGFKGGEIVEFIYGSNKDSAIIRRAIREHDGLIERIKGILEEH